MSDEVRKKGPKNNVVLVITIALLFLGPFGLLCYVMPPDFVIVSPKILHQRVWRFSDALPSTLFGCKPPCSEVA